MYPDYLFKQEMELGKRLTLVFGFTDQGQQALISEAIAALPEGNGVQYYQHPEAHQHPRELLRWLNNLLGAGWPSVVETHSEVACLMVQKAIELHILDAEDVRIYWVKRLRGQPQALDLQILATGGFRQGWPDGKFEESYRILDAMSLPF